MRRTIFHRKCEPWILTSSSAPFLHDVDGVDEDACRFLVGIVGGEGLEVLHPDK